ncbi:hypothetical protein EC912_10348 [Luteibacter rhizovicinus]|uniref:Uncharacterized protein n=1 Tax=Luteibacter rhizovicinus TaxID=242606 RepID=A0A4R3YNW3_9GAMM|nr:hypothetical protein EC912_10348 [Luteibacter rhizovicinus]
MILKRLLFSVGLLLPAIAGAQSVTKYFGYFYGDAMSVPDVPDFHEFQDHVNLYSIMYWSGDSTTPANKDGSEVWVLTELARAKAAHVHAIVPGYPFVLRQVLNEKCFHDDPDAVRGWNSFTQKMVDQGYLIPGDPERSTVVAVYLIDEPNGDACLSDVNGAAHPALQTAFAAIRGNPATATLPVATVLTPDFAQINQGMKLFDWVGFDHYGDSDSQWYGHFNEMKSRAPGKKYIIVPGASNSCPKVKNEDPTRFLNTMNTDPDVIWLTPFKWLSSKSDGCIGVRDIPDRRATYTKVGLDIKARQCSVSRAAKWFCGKAPNISPGIDYLMGN